MKYTRDFYTMWHDTDANRVVTPTRILAYMQETGNLQCKEYDFFLDQKRDENGVAFILGSISMSIKKPIHAYENIKVNTWCKPARGYSFSRYFEVLRDGEVVAEASSLWALVDIHTKALVRGDEGFDKYFPIDEPIPASSLPGRVRIKKDSPLYKVGERKITFSDVDYNMHMNNTKYPDMICDFIGDMQGKFVSGFSLSYLKEAALGETLSVYLGNTDENGFCDVITKNFAGDHCLECKIKVENLE